RSHGVRQRDRRRPGAEDHADRQPGHPVVAARAGREGHPGVLGILFPGRRRADAADPAGHAVRAGPPSCLRKIMERLPELPNINPEQLDMPGMDKLAPVGDLNHPPRILMLYGSLRERSFSRFLTYEAARILEHFGAEVKIFDPMELPMAG